MPPAASKRRRTPYAPKGLIAADRERRCFDLKLAGLTNQAIAEEVGYRDPASVRAAIDRHLARSARGDVEAERALQLGRIDAMLAGGIWQRALDGEPEAVRQVLRLEERRAKLEGLDAPARSQHQVEIDNRAEVRVEVVEMTKQYQALIAEITEDDVETRVAAAGRKAIEATATAIEDTDESYGPVHGEAPNDTPTPRRESGVGTDDTTADENADILVLHPAPSSTPIPVGYTAAAREPWLADGVEG